MEKVSEISRKNDIFVIEDGAHFFAPISKYADAKILSFGREKDVSCVSGGALLWNDNCKYAENFAGISLVESDNIWTIKHLFQPIILAISLKFWFYGGRFFAGFWSKLRLFPRAVTPAEKCGNENFPKTKMPRAIQEVLMQSLIRREKGLEHRQKLAKKWQLILPKLFPEAKITIPDNFFRVILSDVNREEIKKQAKVSGFDLNEWDGNPISPAGVNLAKFDYEKEDCPNAEKFMKNYVTLPTNVRTTETDVENFIKTYIVIASNV
jgi:dTDP-4-amino-4,6-dideoxygalactose transaminase